MKIRRSGLNEGRKRTGKEMINEMALVERIDHFDATAEGFDEFELLADDQMVALTGEHGVFLLVEDNDNVAGRDTGFLIAFAREGDLLTVAHALIDVNFENRLRLDDLLCVARLAAIFRGDYFALAATLSASRLRLLDHTRRQLMNTHLHARPFARSALCHRAFFAAPT